MEVKEAIEWLRSIEENIHGGDESFDLKRKEALNVAISALEKQVPKKIRPASKASPCACPMCGFVGFYNYCGSCGQAIDWTEDEDGET